MPVVDCSTGDVRDFTPEELADMASATTPPDRVTSRQFKLQLLAAGLLDGVEAWIATQDRAIQIAYESSGTFVRSEPMMEAGFTALGFSAGQIDAFFAAAAEL